MGEPKLTEDPGFIRTAITIAIVMALPLALVLYFTRTPHLSARTPASDIYNEQGELVMSEDSLASISRGENDGVRTKPHSLRIFSGLGHDLSENEAERRAGHRVRRGREVALDFDSFRFAVRAPERMVVFTLFNDTELFVHLQAPSALRTNQGVYAGVVDGDEGSQVHLFAADGQLNGVIETSHARYRLLSHPNGLETVTEELVSDARNSINH